MLYNSNLTDGRLQKDQPEMYENLLNNDNYLRASIITKDFVRWKMGELF